MKKPTGIEQAVTAAGGQRKLARQLGVSLAAVQGYLKRGYAPKARAVEIEAEYGISRFELVSPADRDFMSRPFE